MSTKFSLFCLILFSIQFSYSYFFPTSFSNLFRSSLYFLFLLTFFFQNVIVIRLYICSSISSNIFNFGWFLFLPFILLLFLSFSRFYPCYLVYEITFECLPLTIVLSVAAAKSYLCFIGWHIFLLRHCALKSKTIIAYFDSIFPYYTSFDPSCFFYYWQIKRFGIDFYTHLCYPSNNCLNLSMYFSIVLLSFLSNLFFSQYSMLTPSLSTHPFYFHLTMQLNQLCSSPSFSNYLFSV